MNIFLIVTSVMSAALAMSIWLFRSPVLTQDATVAASPIGPFPADNPLLPTWDMHEISFN